MTPKEEASHDAYVAGLGGHTIECSSCQSFTIEVKDDEDENEVMKQAGFVKCVDCGDLLCEECGFNGKRSPLCEACMHERRMYTSSGVEDEDTPSIEWNGFNRPSTY